MTVTKEIVEQRLKDYNGSFDQYRKALDNQLNVAKHINGKFKSNDFLPVKEKDIIKERTILENIYLDSITEKTDNTLILVSDIVRPGYIISHIIENDIIVSPRRDNNLSTEECTVMLFYDNWLNTVLGAYKIGDKIGIGYEQIKN